MNNIKFDLDDIVIIPSESSDIISRSECNPCCSDFMFANLPLMASPMDTVVSKENYFNYIKNKIIPCMPRGIYCDDLTLPYFQSFGLNEIEDSIYEYSYNAVPYKTEFYNHNYILIDMANGHMSKLVDIVKNIKRLFPDIVLMVGNVANPDTFVNLAKAGADYIRCSIGTGCFIPGQIIKLNNNEKNIEDAIIGDEVLTHLNEYKKIINKFEYYINEEIYEIDDIKCTQNHEFYVIEKEYESIVNDENIIQYAKWISAKELDINKHLLIQY